MEWLENTELGTAIDRGHHIAAVAAEGAHLCDLYSAAARNDLEGPDPGRAVILVATPDRARRLARAMRRRASADDPEVVLWTAERAVRAIPVADRAILIATPARLLSDVRSGDASLSDIRLLVLDDMAALRDEWPAVDGLLQATSGEEIRRIAITHARDDEFDELTTRLLPRARRWPPELFRPDDEEIAKPSGPPLRWGTGETLDARLRRLVELLHEWAADTEASRVSIWSFDEASTGRIADALAIEGFATSRDPADEGIVIRDMDGAGDADPPEGPAVVFGLPRSLAETTATLGAAKPRAAIVAPRHVRQLEILGLRAGWPVRSLPDAPRGPRDEIEGFRDRIEAAIETRDLAAASLLIEPLVAEHGYDRVSSALASLLRDVVVPGEDVAPGASASRAPATASPEPKIRPKPSAETRRASSPTWSKVFVNVGRQDGAAPGDFVGAITGETGAVGGQIGKIDIKQRFSLIDVDSLVVNDVIRGLNGKQIKGRDVTARLDRQS